METTIVYSKLGVFVFDVPVSIEIDTVTVIVSGGSDSATLIIGKDDVSNIAHFEKPHDFVEYYVNIWLMNVNTLMKVEYNTLADMMMEIQKF